jgi:4-amino-4-deoxy-L-arabinose transferase-like glycosyltransferase
MIKTFPASALGLGVRRQVGAPQSRHYTSRLLLVAAALLAATQLRAAHMLENRFHQDEALYATFARFIASGPGRGLLLSHMLVDKPPLAFYINGLSVAIFGGSEFALRLPTLLASILSVALVYAIGRRLFGAPAGLAAAWVMALSPFAILFSITIFVDPLLTTSVLLAILLLVRGRPGWAALALALAWGTKQTALLFVPLALLLGLFSLARPLRPRLAANFLLRAMLPALAGIALVTILLFAWDIRRGAPISLFEQGYNDNTTSRLASLAELRPRADVLLKFLHYFAGNDLISVLFLVGLAALIVYDARRRSRAGWVSALLVIYIAGYMATYWLVSLNLFDRYFLPIVPLCALLAGRLLDAASRGIAAGLGWLSQRAQLDLVRARQRAWLLARVAVPLALLVVVTPATAAVNYDFSPIGGDHGAYDGVDDAARYIRTLPHNVVLYDHWLSWEFDYYLFGQPVRTFYYPDGQALTRDLTLHGHRSPRYLVVPSWARDLNPRAAAQLAGYSLRRVHQSFRRDGLVSFTIYQLDPAPWPARPVARDLTAPYGYAKFPALH